MTRRSRFYSRAAWRARRAVLHIRKRRLTDRGHGTCMPRFAKIAQPRRRYTVHLDYSPVQLLLNEVVMSEDHANYSLHPSAGLICLLPRFSLSIKQLAFEMRSRLRLPTRARGLMHVTRPCDKYFTCRNLPPNDERKNKEGATSRNGSFFARKAERMLCCVADGRTESQIIAGFWRMPR